MATIHSTKGGASPLWVPTAERIRDANITAFTRRFGPTLGLAPDADYEALHRASVTQSGPFWQAVWEMADFPGEPGATGVSPGAHFLDWAWFPDARLNYAEAMVDAGAWRGQRQPALIAQNERGQRQVWSREDLKQRVAALAGHLQNQGIRPNDRIAAVLPNIPETVVAMLATAAIGAIWSCCSPEFGEDAILDRFGQIDPKILLACPTAWYNGKSWDHRAKIERVIARLPTVDQLIWVQEESTPPPLAGRDGLVSIVWGEALRGATPLTSWPRFPFDQPLCLLYSSGTTGKPKGILHGAGGTLLQHAKEHALHCDIKPGDRVFYYTTTGWMMWNWLVGALGRGATILLFDGSPLAQGWETLWRLAQDEGVTHFGASPRFYATVDKEGGQPGQAFDLSRLRTLFSTGSPLPAEGFEWIYRAVKTDLHLASISGGTDIVSCFVLGHPTLPVYAGQIQCKGLGMDVDVVDAQGQSLKNEPGELVCKTPFPSRPISFWNDPEHRRYLAAYFETYPGIWRHGDWAQFTPQGGIIIHGRSDATLNPGGVRIGTAEIYECVEGFATIQESLAVPLKKEADETILLFVKMRPGHTLDAALCDSIRQALRRRCSPRHVPETILEAPDFPRTISGKLSEIAVRNALNGVKLGNEGALANPESLAFFKTRPWTVHPGQTPMPQSG